MRMSFWRACTGACVDDLVIAEGGRRLVGGFFSAFGAEVLSKSEFLPPTLYQVSIAIFGDGRGDVVPAFQIYAKGDMGVLRLGSGCLGCEMRNVAKLLLATATE